MHVQMTMNHLYQYRNDPHLARITLLLLFIAAVIGCAMLVAALFHA